MLSINVPQFLKNCVTGFSPLLTKYKFFTMAYLMTSLTSPLYILLLTPRPMGLPSAPGKRSPLPRCFLSLAQIPLSPNWAHSQSEGFTSLTACSNVGSYYSLPHLPLSLLGIKKIWKSSVYVWKSSVYVCFTPQKVSPWEQDTCLFSVLLDTRAQNCGYLWNKRVNNGSLLLPSLFFSYHHKGFQEIYHPSKNIFFFWLIHEIISTHMYSFTDLLTYSEYTLSPYYVQIIRRKAGKEVWVVHVCFDSTGKNSSIEFI